MDNESVVGFLGYILGGYTLTYLAANYYKDLDLTATRRISNLASDLTLACSFALSSNLDMSSDDITKGTGLPLSVIHVVRDWRLYNGLDVFTSKDLKRIDSEKLMLYGPGFYQLCTTLTTEIHRLPAIGPGSYLLKRRALMSSRKLEEKFSELCF